MMGMGMGMDGFVFIFWMYKAGICCYMRYM